jgi:hypothetical protein
MIRCQLSDSISVEILVSLLYRSELKSASREGLLFLEVR